MLSWASLRRSSPFILRNSAIRRLKLQSFSNPAAPVASCSSSSFSESISGQEQGKAASYFQLLLGSVSGAVIISTLGMCLWSSSSSLSFEDSTASISSTEDDQRDERKAKFLFGVEFRRRVFFNYEKRIRLRSPPEKIFEYFASVRSPEGEIFMTPADLMRAVVPVFPPSESNFVREGYLRGERPPGHLHCADSALFKLFDTNNDGLISFPEYIFFVTLLSIPESSFSVAFKMFDLDHDGEIERDEFKKVMALMRSHNRQGTSHRQGRRTGLKIIESRVENGGLVEYFFGKDGDECLQHDKFVLFLKRLHHEILRLEFDHYDFKQQGTISAKDFALSIVASADMTHINKFLNRVDELNNDPHLRDIRITFKEFLAFAELRKRLHDLSLAIFGYGEVNGSLTREDFQRATSHVCDISVTDDMVNIIFHVFDANHDGNLSAEEFLGALQRREKDIAHPTETGIIRLLSCSWNCTRTSPFEQNLQ